MVLDPSPPPLPMMQISSVAFPQTPKHCVWFFGFCETPKHSVWFFGFCRPVCKGMRHWKYRLIIIVVIPQTRAHSTTRTKHSVFGNVWCFGFCAFQRSVVSHRMSHVTHEWFMYVTWSILPVSQVFTGMSSHAVRDSYMQFVTHIVYCFIHIAKCQSVFIVSVKILRLLSI